MKIISISERENTIMVVSRISQLPEYTTILGQAMSPCGSWYVAATTTGHLAVWSLAGLVAGEGELKESGRQVLAETVKV